MAFIQEIRQALLRLVRRNKGFTFAVVLSTALGVGATASIFSLIATPFSCGLSRFPTRAASSASRRSHKAVRSAGSRIPKPTRSAPALRRSPDWPRHRTRCFGFSQTPAEQPRVTIGVLVNGDFFSTLGVRPVLGRAFTADEDEVPGRNAVVIISYGTWQREFGGRSDVIGRRIRLNAVEFTVVGVVPEWFVGIHPFLQPALYVPRMMIREASGARRTRSLIGPAGRSEIFARLKPGVSIEQARDEMAPAGGGHGAGEP